MAKKTKHKQAYEFRKSHIPIYIMLTIGAVIAVIPFFYMFSTSLMTLGETINKTLIPAQPQFGNYSEAWNEAKFSKYFLNSAIITSLTILGTLLVVIPAGYAFANIKFPGRSIFFMVLLATMMIPYTVIFLPNLLMIRGKIIPWGSHLNTLEALIIPFLAGPFYIFLLRQFFIGIPKELWDAARIDGAGHGKFLTSIVVPISTPVILTVTLLTFIHSWNEFIWPLLVTTTPKWRPLGVGLYSFVTEAGPETQLLMAGSVITLLPVLILYFVTQKYFTEGIATSGLKG